MINIKELFDKLKWNNNILIQRQGINEGLKIKDISIFLKPWLYYDGDCKAILGNCARIIYKKNDDELKPYLYELFEVLKDLNCPGALLINKRLFEFKKNNYTLYNEMLQKVLKEAEDNHNNVWKETLLEIDDTALYFICPDIEL